MWWMILCPGMGKGVRLAGAPLGEAAEEIVSMNFFARRKVLGASDPALVISGLPFVQRESEEARGRVWPEAL